MRVNELLRRYDFHDSLLEDMMAGTDTLEMTIGLCAWRQSGYREGDAEVTEMRLFFEGVSSAALPAEPVFDDDTILTFACTACKKGTNEEWVKLVLRGDDDVKVIEFATKGVRV